MENAFDEILLALCEGIRAHSVPLMTEAATRLRLWLPSQKVGSDGLVLGLGALNRAGRQLGPAGALGGEGSLPAVEVLVTGESVDFRNLSCHALAGVGSVAPAAVEPLVRRLAADPNWTVREIIANALDDHVGTAQGDALFAMMERFATDPDENIRRLPTNALMRYGRRHQDRVIGLMGRLRYDSSGYVRKNVVFCLSVLGAVKNPMIGIPDASNPDRLMAWLREWLSEEDPNSRWVIAETLGRKWTRGHEADAGLLLDLLATDARPAIQRAVARARKALAASGAS